MDITLLLVSALFISIAALGAVIYRLVKSLELYLIPLYAEVIRKRERDYVLFDFLASLLVSKGLITSNEANAIKTMATTGPLTIEELDKVDEILDKDPRQLTFEEVFDLKRVAYKLLGRLDKRSVRLGMKLLKYVTRIEEAVAASAVSTLRNTKRVEMSYDDDTCTVFLTIYKKGGEVERTQGPDLDCVMQTISILRTLARRGAVNGQSAEKALRRYVRCKNSETPGCRSINEALGTLEKKSLDILIEKRGAKENN